MNGSFFKTGHNGDFAPATPGFNAVGPEWMVRLGAADAAPSIPAAESTLESHPCVALSSAQVIPEWTTSTLPCNDFSANGNYPLNSLSQSRGSLQNSNNCSHPIRGTSRRAVTEWLPLCSPEAQKAFEVPRFRRAHEPPRHPRSGQVLSRRDRGAFDTGRRAPFQTRVRWPRSYTKTRHTAYHSRNLRAAENRAPGPRDRSPAVDRRCTPHRSRQYKRRVPSQTVDRRCEHLPDFCEAEIPDRWPAFRGL